MTNNTPEREALAAIMRATDAAKEPCGSDPESPAAIRNAKFAGIASIAAQGLGLIRGQSLAASPAAGGVQPLTTYEPTVLIDECRGRTTATGAAMKQQEGGRWVRLSDVQAATPPAAPAAASDEREALAHEIYAAAQLGPHDGIEDAAHRISVLLAARAPQAAPQPTAQAEAASVWRKAVQEAYGWLWHVNNEPMAPVPLWSPEKAAYEARKNLRELLTVDERGEAINSVRGMLENMAAAQPSGESK